MKVVPLTVLELRHNNEALGRVASAGVVEIFHDVLQAEPRFWMGLRALREHERPQLRWRRQA